MDFTSILNSVIDVVKGIEWDKVIATVKDVAEKVIPIITDKVIPFITDLVGKIA